MEEKKLTLYDCATLFIESMPEKFPKGDNSSAILMLATNGKKLAYLMEGPDELVSHMVSQLSIVDEEARNVIGEGIVKALNHLKNQKNDTVNQTTE